MMKRTFRFFPLVMLISWVGMAQVQAQRPYELIDELENLQRADQLPTYRSGEYIGQISS